MKTAIYQSGYGILGIGADLDEAINSANEFLGPDEQLTIEDAEVARGGEVHGKIYYATITDALVAQVESEGGDVDYERDATNVLMTPSEYEEVGA